ncbi:MAG: hypothetical protein ACLVCH_01200 [Roseburia inulinivorans]
MYLVLYTDMDIEHQEQAYMKYLIDDLEEYAQSDYYPFHMPGHKERVWRFPIRMRLTLRRLTDLTICIMRPV